MSVFWGYAVALLASGAAVSQQPSVQVKVTAFYKQGKIAIKDIPVSTRPSVALFLKHYPKKYHGPIYASFRCTGVAANKLKGCRIEASDPKDVAFTKFATGYISSLSVQPMKGGHNLEFLSLDVAFDDGQFTYDNRCLPPFCIPNSVPPAPAPPPPPAR